MQAGLASVHFTADRSKYARELYSSEDTAKAEKEKVMKSCDREGYSMNTVPAFFHSDLGRL